MTKTTTDVQALVERYFDMWNAHDADERRAVVASTFVEDGTYVDPLFDVAGHEGLDGMVAAAHQAYPGLRFRRTGEVDVHHDRVRWSWELGADGQPAVAGGVDYARLAADGRLAEVTGFIDFAPTPA
jgi:hypothetical protein